MKVPAKGFYYHHKHDPNGPFNNYAYEVVGVAMHSEDKTYTVIYRPLYENTYLSVDFSARPLEMFMEEVEKNGKRFPRFSPITDPALIKRLEGEREKMYPPETRG